MIPSMVGEVGSTVFNYAVKLTGEDKSMPNGGRKGDNEWSWFMDDLCAGRAKCLGDPIDALACEIYQITGDEHFAGIGPRDKMDEIDLSLIHI